MKNILVIGSGGREHALAWKISQSPNVAKVFILPGNAASSDKIESIGGSYSDFDYVTSVIKEKQIYYTVVGPEGPLSEGIVDKLSSIGYPVFGPSAIASRLESSKIYSKEVMMKAGIPTANAQVFSSTNEALSYLKKSTLPIVIKADGLALGKGVTVALNYSEAENAVRECLESSVFGTAGREILIEDCIAGKEASVMAIISKKQVCFLPVSSDYKRLLDEHKGPNTGGMGAVSPTTVFSEQDLDTVRTRVFEPLLNYLETKGIEYAGFLYAGLMVEANGDFKVLEFNCRLGDPETQALMMRIDNDLFEILEKAIFSPLELPKKLDFSSFTSMTVVMSSKGYPAVNEDNKEIVGINKITDQGVVVFNSGTKILDDKVFSKGGRILTVTTKGTNVEDCRSKVYAAIQNIKFEGAHCRKDIGL